MDPLIAKLERRFSPEFSRLLAKRIDQTVRAEWQRFKIQAELSEVNAHIGTPGIKARRVGMCAEMGFEEPDF